MAVKVVTRKQTASVSEKTDTYESSTSFHIKEGHLVVTEWDGAGENPRGVYSPDEWVKAYVVDAMA